MTVKFTLWTRGQYFIDEDFEIPDWLAAMDFETNVLIRERSLAEHEASFRDTYHKIILKHGNDAQISITFPTDPEHRGHNEKKYILPLIKHDNVHD